jgi:demethylmenaquinone methyltransferase/2-methoxy-6-polyprenyl-1,4-benzoquinol methylase
MFAGIAGRYDLANRLLSGGMDIYWRRVLVAAVARQQPRVVVDLATGSGDVAFALRDRLGPAVDISGLDFCEPMLAQAERKQQRRHGRAPVRFAPGDCLNLPLADGSVDALTIAFGLRNLEDRARGLREMRRVLRSGGALYVLEFSQPAAWLRPVYFFYLRHVLPLLAGLVTGRRAAYHYLAGSIGSFPTRAGLADEFRAAGFARVQARGLSGSIVALHVGR